MQKFIFTLIFSLFFCSIFSQNSYYVQFKDKNGTLFSLNSPQNFLSARALQRRTNQGIALDSTDLPVSQTYLNALVANEATILYRLKWFNGAEILLSNPAKVADIEALPFVEFVERTKTVLSSPNPRQNTPQQTSDLPAEFVQNSMLGVDLLHNEGFRGAGKLIAVLDAGFPNVNTMSAFDTIRARIVDTYNFVDMNANVYQHNSHGTLVLSTIGAHIENQIYGTAPEASFALYISEEDGRETRREPDNWIAAAERADSIGADIITSSLGYYFFDDSPNLQYSDLDGKTTRVSRAATITARKGMVVVNSAGNEATSEWHYIIAPADADSILCVGAVTKDSANSTFSSYGPSYDMRVKPDICAQGTNAFVVNTSNVLATANGTSFAAPIAAGMAASLWSAMPNVTNVSLMQKIRESAHRYSNPDVRYGYGIPNVWNIYENSLTTIQNVVSGNQNFFLEIKDNFLIIKCLNTDSYTFALFDIIGRKIVSDTKNGNAEIALPNIVNGVYIVLIKNKNGIFSEKIIKK
ncbi:MAG: S8 family peptidase [Prevotellaceae bacterium]|jgi:subtilisin family serine protease|nr:S8 family peptidase [Prevotellaceae bacterium]